nr:sulfite exporter TauE/SafE family protein [Solirubrobacterales bacterium]
LPALVYVLGEPVGPASTASLIVVAVAAAVGAGALALRGHPCWRIGLAFSVPAAAGSLLGAFGNSAADPTLLILTFVPVMLLASGATWQRAARGDPDGTSDCPPLRLDRTLVAGLAVGVLTGFFGVGGGFMIVPVLTLWLGFSFRRAVATSLVIITITGLAALAGHLALGAELDLPVTIALGTATAVGALLGTIIGTRLPQHVIGRAFAIVVSLLAAFLLIDTLLLGGPPQG